MQAVFCTCRRRKPSRRNYKICYTAGLVRVSREIEQVALPSIRLHAHREDETQLKPGGTRFGGAPDVPQQREWPEYHGSALPFVGQINLAEMAPYTTERLLPDSGILSFFFDVDAFFKTWPGGSYDLEGML